MDLSRKPSNHVQTIERVSLILDMVGQNPRGISLGDIAAGLNQIFKRLSELDCTADQRKEHGPKQHRQATIPAIRIFAAISGAGSILHGALTPIPCGRGRAMRNPIDAEPAMHSDLEPCGTAVRLSQPCGKSSVFGMLVHNEGKRTNG